MKRTPLVLAAAFALLATAAGCNLRPGSSATTPATTTGVLPSPSASPTPSPTPSGDGSGVQFTVDGVTFDGLNVYTLGKTLTDLQAGPGLTEVTVGSTACPNNTFARGKGGPISPLSSVPVYEGVQLSFRQDGRLYLVVDTSDALPTPNGIYLGYTKQQVLDQYKNLTQIPLTRGSDQALLIRTISGGAILFEFDSGGRVTAMTAGEPTYLQNTWTANQPFC